jgi:hypothetical protein
LERRAEVGRQRHLGRRSRGGRPRLRRVIDCFRSPSLAGRRAVPPSRVGEGAWVEEFILIPDRRLMRAYTRRSSDRVERWQSTLGFPSPDEGPGGRIERSTQALPGGAGFDRPAFSHLYGHDVGSTSRHRLYDRTAFDAKRSVIDINCPLARGGSPRARSANMLHFFPCFRPAGVPWPISSSTRHVRH